MRYKEILMCLIRASPGCHPKFTDLKPLFDKLQDEYAIFGKDASDMTIGTAVDMYRTADLAYA